DYYCSSYAGSRAFVF
nr:immunoglobulin light chain junction region [Macaca mulatta]MOW16906.1 immunoglobulin light chain junction region [Macaca mulatta]MOW17146.1 immunoglobulin light chain junction region [Macaca mulatta]